jgi:enoyl-CoA hydratase
MSTNPVLRERRGRTLIVTINRPEAKNAVNRAVSFALAEAADELDESEDLSVAVLTGAGGNFCAGMDLKAFAAGEEIAVPERGLGFTTRPPRKPIIAAVEGYALAGGTELVLACDLVIASKTAFFGLPEVKRGLVAGGGGLLRLPHRIPYQIAMEFALTGDNLPVEQAHRYGLVNHVVVPGSALDTALEVAARITANGPLAVATTKQVIIESSDWPGGEAFERQQALLAPVFASADALEGARAFAEKRPPVWQGR